MSFATGATPFRDRRPNAQLRGRPTKGICDKTYSGVDATLPSGFWLYGETGPHQCHSVARGATPAMTGMG